MQDIPPAIDPGSLQGFPDISQAPQTVPLLPGGLPTLQTLQTIPAVSAVQTLQTIPTVPINSGYLNNGDWAVQQAVAQQVGQVIDMKGEGGLSTLHVSSFPNNVNDREMENFFRFLPGFVSAKATVEGKPKAWVRFDHPQAANNAFALLEQIPFDLRDPESKLYVTMAKTDMNPENMTRRNGVLCMSGKLDTLLGLDSGIGEVTEGAQKALAQPSATGTIMPAAAITGGTISVAGALGIQSAGIQPVPKKQKIEVPTTGELDTCVIMKPLELGVSLDQLHVFMMSVEGYLGMRMGGNNCFVKFISQAHAERSISLVSEAGMTAQFAKSSMNLSQATHLNQVATAG
eukprot:gnl/MRDRNA2_/MRDRNA2_112856_c0_seq1.p1 gnl/MRDRNA2_/MRDRNA2_112856_c0~~gnl/MRDRNA2_/MRDRNA2_112856_c0_seq1.p1  ORF type:complete len:345 (+),score=41.54 gnl/MRDRNA2_/MRDRNA2_112856_c0_seq1:57-1091(+)